MAITDHTAHACLPVCNEPDLDIFSDTDSPSRLHSEARHVPETLVTKLSGAMHGVVVIQGLLDRWLAEQRAHAYGEPLPRLRPLTAQQVSGLNAALRILHEHRDRIRSEVVG